jgi:hypothetical protein
MGSRTTRPNRGQPDRAYPSGMAESDTLGVDTGSSENGGGGSEPEDCVDIQLIRVDATVQSAAKFGDKAWLKTYEVHVQSGRLGDIPHSLRIEIDNQSYKKGRVVNIEVPTVRFCSGK